MWVDGVLVSLNMLNLSLDASGYWQVLTIWCITFPQIVNRHGPEADRHLLRCLFSHVDFSGDGKSSGKDFHQVINVASALKIETSFYSQIYQKWKFISFRISFNVLLPISYLLQTQFLIQECVSLITKPNFISTLCYAIDNPLHYQKVCWSGFQNILPFLFKFGSFVI